MKNYLTTVCILITLFSYSQTNFLKGYVIQTNNNRVDCLIKNEDWKNNPTHFKYKLSENSVELTGAIEQIKEFGIENEFKYIKQKVDIDISSNNLTNLSYVKDPSWENRTVYLKVLLEGDASLYFYAAPGLNRYFYNIKNGEIVQLIYKRYNFEHQKVKSNNNYRQQLLNSFSSCSSLGLNDYKNVNYNSPSLSKLVKTYNNCLNGETVNYTANSSGLKFHLKIKGGINIASVNGVKREFVTTRNVSFGSMLGFRVALESEVILPFNNNKWGLFLELAKNQKSEKTTDATNGTSTFSYDYFEGLMGMRHYLYLNKTSKVSIHLGYAWDLSSKLNLDYENYANISGDRVSGSFLIGLGYHYKDFSLEARINIKKAMLEVNTALYSSDSNNISITLGYNIL